MFTTRDREDGDALLSTFSKRNQKPFKGAGKIDREIYQEARYSTGQLFPVAGHEAIQQFMFVKTLSNPN